MKKCPAIKKKINIQIECDDELANSVYSEIGPDGLRFLKDDIKVSKEGLTKVSGDNYKNFSSIKIDDIESSGKMIGGGAACSV